MDDKDDIFGEDAFDELIKVEEPVLLTQTLTLDQMQLQLNAEARVTGTVAVTARQVDVLRESLTGRFAERYVNLMETATRTEFIKMYIAALPYVQPKFKGVEPTVTKKPSTKLEVVHKTISEDQRTLPKLDNKYKKQVGDGS